MARRTTKHKQAILEVFENNHLLSAKELAVQIPQADQSTIYRNLNRLAKDEVLRRVQTEAVTKYELADKHQNHDHFICDDCDTVETIFVDKSLKSKLPSTENCSLTVRGVCKKCA